jgi:hypothetical protein
MNAVVPVPGNQASGQGAGLAYKNGARNKWKKGGSKVKVVNAMKEKKLKRESTLAKARRMSGGE